MPGTCSRAGPGTRQRGLRQQLTHTLVSLTKPCAIAAPYDCQVPDYDESIIQRAVQALASKQLGEYAHRQRLEALAAGGWSIRGLACWGGRLLLVPPACVLV